MARAVKLDSVEASWHPTTDIYLGRVTKSRILEAVCEVNGELLTPGFPKVIHASDSKAFAARLRVLSA